MSHPTTPFWQEIRQSLMVRGDGWKQVVESVPDHLNMDEMRLLLQSPDQLSHLSGFGYIAGERINTTVNPAVAEFLIPLSLENIALQWLYRFLIVEGLVEHNRATPMLEWPAMFLHMVDQGLNFMVVMAAILVLIEENRAKFDVSADDQVTERIKEACAFLHPKAQDYGESFRRHGLPGILPRLWDKIARYCQLKSDARAANFEKREDSAKDLLGYSIIAYSLMLELPKEFRESYQPFSSFETESNTFAGAEWKRTK